MTGCAIRVGSLDCARYVFLTDPHTGHGLAVVDEHWTYGIRSAAAATLACKWLGPARAADARPRRHRLHGHQRAALPYQTLPFRGNPLHIAPARDARGLCREWSAELGIPVRACDSVEEVVRGADLAVGGTTPPRS